MRMSFATSGPRATERAEHADRHLLLVVDGLDEDLSSAKGLPSVASLLPAAAGGKTHVLVASRPYPELPGDVDLDHPHPAMRRVRSLSTLLALETLHSQTKPGPILKASLHRSSSPNGVFGATRRSPGPSPATTAGCGRWRSAPTGSSPSPAAMTARCASGTSPRDPARRPAHRFESGWGHRRHGTKDTQSRIDLDMVLTQS
jgi:hypothetical protein